MKSATMSKQPPSPLRDAFGGVIIRSYVTKPGGRKGFEKQFFPGVSVGLIGWDRAHSQGNITGHESPFAIRYAPSEVNQAYQRLGIERFVRELYEEKAEGIELLLTTVTYSHPGTLRLKEIQYKVDALHNGSSRPYTLFEASINVENKRISPKVHISATPRLSQEDLEKILKKKETSKDSSMR